MANITVRIRYAGGTLRVNDAQPTWSLEQLKEKIRVLLGLSQSQNVVLSPQPLGAANSNHDLVYLDDSVSLKELGITHGTMLFMDSVMMPVVPATNTAPGEKKAVDASGTLVVSNSNVDKAAFRPGLQSLRSQKLHWTLTEMTEYDDMYTFKIKGKEPLFCSSASLDLPSAQAFQQYCSLQGFKKPRAALMFGRFVEPETEKKEEEKKVKRYGETKARMRISDFAGDDKEKPTKYVTVEALYDPKQEIRDGNFFIDFSEDGIARAIILAKEMEMTWVGIMFSHGMDRAYNFSAHEILQCGVACLEATDGAVDSPFAIIKVAPTDDGIQMDAFQLTKTCLEMIKEEALENMPNEPAFFGVNERYQVIVEAKPALVVDTDFFIKRVPIKSHTSTVVNFGFARLNRDNVSPNTLKNALNGKYSNPTLLRKVMKDFNLLLYLAQLLGVDTVVELTRNLMAEPVDEPVPEGFILMIQEITSH